MTFIHKEMANGKWRELTLMEQLDLTIQDPKNKYRLKEICRCRELLVDYFAYDNIYGSSDELWHNYFYAFAYLARMQQYQRNNSETNC